MNKSKQEEEITPEKKWKSATIANNFISTKSCGIIRMFVQNYLKYF